MTPKVLASILSEHGKADNEGTVYTLPDGTTATLYSSLGSDSLTIRANIVRLDETMLVATSGTEVFVLAYEDVRAVRFQKRRSTGYGT